METQPDQLETVDKYLQENSLTCKLFIHPVNDASQILIVDENNKVILVKEEPTEDFFKGKPRILSLMRLLNLRFLETFIVVTPKETVLTPFELYDAGNLITPTFNPNDTHSSIVSAQKCVASFLLCEDQKSWLTMLKDAKLLPSTQVMIEYLAGSKVKYKTVLSLNFLGDQFEAVLLKDNDLEFYGKFSCATADEFNFFLLTLFEKLSLPAALIQIYLWGSITEGDENFKRIFKYNRNLTFPEYDHPSDFNLLIAATECV